MKLSGNFTTILPFWSHHEVGFVATIDGDSDSAPSSSWYLSPNKLYFSLNLSIAVLPGVRPKKK